jgi:hypothetical protein
MSLADYQTIVTDLVRDDAGKITAGQRDRAIAQALARLSAERPRQVAEDIADASGALVATPPGWVVGESSLVSVETPIGEVPPVLVVGVTVLAQPDGTERLAFSSPLAAGTAIRVRYSLLHLVDSQRDTVPAPLQWGVAALAASMLCGQLAALYANQGDSTISADSVVWRMGRNCARISCRSTPEVPRACAWAPVASHRAIQAAAMPTWKRSMRSM